MSEFENDLPEQQPPTAVEVNETKDAPEDAFKSCTGFKHPKEAAPIRRVGTLTMGVALIVTGIIALICMFFPHFDLSLVFKLSPLLFVFLGLEILAGCFFHKGARLRYDWLSGFVCFILVCAGAGMAALPTVWSYAGPPAMQAREKLNQQIESKLYDALKDNGSINRMHVNVEIPYYRAYTSEMSFEELSKDTSSYLYFNLAGTYADQKAFAADCANILRVLQTLPVKYNHIEFRYDGDTRQMQLDVSDLFQMHLDVDRLAQNVESETVEVKSAEDH